MKPRRPIWPIDHSYPPDIIILIITHSILTRSSTKISTRRTSSRKITKSYHEFLKPSSLSPPPRSLSLKHSSYTYYPINHKSFIVIFISFVHDYHPCRPFYLVPLYDHHPSIPKPKQKFLESLQAGLGWSHHHLAHLAGSNVSLDHSRNSSWSWYFFFLSFFLSFPSPQAGQSCSRINVDRAQALW